MIGIHVFGKNVDMVPLCARSLSTLRLRYDSGVNKTNPWRCPIWG